MNPLLPHARLCSRSSPFAAGARRSAAGLDVARADVQKFVAHDAQRARLRPAGHGVDACATPSRSRASSRSCSARPSRHAALVASTAQRFLTDERIAGGVAVWQDNRDALAAHRAATAACRRSTWWPSPAWRPSTDADRRLPRARCAGHAGLRLSAARRLLPKRARAVPAADARGAARTRANRMGSYAGAMGIAQFMPSSFRRFAVDGSGDGRRDLWHVRARRVRQHRQLLQASTAGMPASRCWPMPATTRRRTTRPRPTASSPTPWIA